jgi:hypothetical protein
MTRQVWSAGVVLLVVEEEEEEEEVGGEPPRLLVFSDARHRCTEIACTRARSSRPKTRASVAGPHRSRDRSSTTIRCGCRGRRCIWERYATSAALARWGPSLVAAGRYFRCRCCSDGSGRRTCIAPSKSAEEVEEEDGEEDDDAAPSGTRRARCASGAQRFIGASKQRKTACWPARHAFAARWKSSDVLPQPAGPASSTKSSAGEARADRVGGEEEEGGAGARRRAGPDSWDRDRDMNSFEFSQS